MSVGTIQVQDYRIEGRWFDPQLDQYSFQGNNDNDYVEMQPGA